MPADFGLTLRSAHLCRYDEHSTTHPKSAAADKQPYNTLPPLTYELSL